MELQPEMEDRSRPEATFSYTVKVTELKDTNKRLKSPPCYVRCLPWHIEVYQDCDDMDFLNFYLWCSWNGESDWSCNTVAELRLISHKPDKSFCKHYKHEFSSSCYSWGYPKFVDWNYIFDKDNGFIKDDAITLEVHIIADEPLNTGYNVGGYKLGGLIIEGKTKQVFDLPELPGHCLLLNKDRITAGDGVKAHDLEGKAAISNQTNAKVFEILKATGLKTAYVKMVSPTAFVSKKCEMIPIEWVTRRLATGSFLKRNEGVPEGFRFTPPKQETFFKDDANHDPQWSEEQIICAKFNVNGLVIGRDEVDYMRKATILVFEILEKAWALRDCALIDMKIEFGVDSEGNILLADVIDSDSWRLWPSGDKRLMVDKQVYRNLSTVTAADLDTVKRNFAWVKDQLDHLKPKIHHKVVVFMGSPADMEHCQKIAKAARELGLEADLRVTSAHKATEETLRIMQQYEDTHGALVFIAVAGRSNGLGPVLSGNTSYPVINCPPPSDKLVQDIWSSLSVPSGLGCATVIYPDSAALMAAQIIGLQDYLVWARLRVKQLDMAASLRQADKKVRV